MSDANLSHDELRKVWDMFAGAVICVNSDSEGLEPIHVTNLLKGAVDEGEDELPSTVYLDAGGERLLYVFHSGLKDMTNWAKVIKAMGEEAKIVNEILNQPALPQPGRFNRKFYKWIEFAIYLVETWGLVAVPPDYIRSIKQVERLFDADLASLKGIGSV
jgi:hypothetical protein